MEWRDGCYLVSTERARLDVDFIHGYLTAAYWARGRTYNRVRQSIEGSLCFGLYDGEAQIGFARVITDYATAAHLVDVFVIDAHRGKGLGKWLIETVFDHPPLSAIEKWTLATSDAHALYARYGFAPLSDPDSLMERLRASADT